MKVILFTSNQPRHVSLINRLNEVCDLTAVVETTTSLASGYHSTYTSEVKAEYFRRVAEAEWTVFPDCNVINAKTIPRRMGDLPDGVPTADRYIVSGASWIQGPLCDLLIENKAINIHMGIAPEYKGSSCNFWAMYDYRPDLVGATVHMLSKGLDSGGILWKSGSPITPHPFQYTMEAVAMAHRDIVWWVEHGALFDSTPRPQDKSKEKRYTRASDFTDEICAEYLERINAL
jgi:methionyl-tRNA formyltransferase